METIYIGDLANLSFAVKYPFPLQSVELKIERGNEVFPHECNIQNDIVSALVKGERIGRHTAFFRCLFEDSSVRSFPIDYLVKERNRELNYLETIQNIRDALEKNPDKAEDLMYFVTSKLQDSKAKEKFISIWNQEMPKKYRNLLETQLNAPDFNPSNSGNTQENKVGGFSVPQLQSAEYDTQQTGPIKVIADEEVKNRTPVRNNMEPYFEKMLEIKAPNPVRRQGKIIFLAGSIDMGKAEDWQTKVTEALKDEDVTILNPRRNDWDSSWKQEIENPEFREQVNWELDGQEKSDIIAMYFGKESKSPISLLELGLFADTDKMIIFCPEGFYRKGNVDIVAKKYGIKVTETFDDFINEIKNKLNNKIEKQEKVYLRPGEEPPEGTHEFRGRKGGRYYVPEEHVRGEESVLAFKFNVSAVNKLKPTIEKFRENVSKVLEKLPVEHVNNSEFYLVGEKDLVDFTGDICLGRYEPVSGIISISESSDNADTEALDKMYEGTLPGISHPWILIVLHELGHRVSDLPGIKSYYRKLLDTEDVRSSYISVSKYALTDIRERFAECYMYYIQNPRWLKEKDPDMYKLMHDDVFNNKEFEEPIVKQLGNQDLPLGSYWIEVGKYSKKVLKENQIQKSLEFNPNLDDDEFYKMIDDILEVQVEPNIQKSHLVPKEQRLPPGSKKLAEQCELEIYKTLRGNINDWFETIEKTSDLDEVISNLKMSLYKWRKEEKPEIRNAMQQLYAKGLEAGMRSTGILITPKKKKIDYLVYRDTGISPALDRFKDETFNQVAKIVRKHYAPETGISLYRNKREIDSWLRKQRFQTRRMLKTETAKIAGYGLLKAWAEDPNKYNFQYIWNSQIDERTKMISKQRYNNNFYSYPEIQFLFEHQIQMIEKELQDDSFNQRCWISREPIDYEWKDNRFYGQEFNYRRTAPRA